MIWIWMIWTIWTAWTIWTTWAGLVRPFDQTPDLAIGAKTLPAAAAVGIVDTEFAVDYKLFHNQQHGNRDLMA